MKIQVFDTETGGLDPSMHSLLSVGYVVGDLANGEVLHAAEDFVKLDSVDDYVITDGAFGVHGISAEQCMDVGIPVSEIADRFTDCYVEHGCQLYGGHNVAFDVRFLCKHVFDFKGPYPEIQFESNFTYHKIDSLAPMELFADLPNVGTGKRLERAIKVLKVDMSDVTGNYHGALFDTIACFKVMCRIRELFGQLAID
jgi:DNA polymerase III epsilon subunit-like protein